MSREGRKRWGFFQTFVIGKQDNPMMKRLRLIQTPWFGIYLHFIYREDLDPVPHDHPWRFWRMVLWGGYSENYTVFPADPTFLEHRLVVPFQPSRVPTNHAHHITKVAPHTISLVVVGRKERVWGFWQPIDGWPDHARWVDYRDALGLRPTEGVHGEGVRP